MTYSARVLADSISPEGIRLTTLEVTMPRIILSEANTHKIISKNSASSRAIPVKRKNDAIKSNPFIPEAFGKNKAGMSAEEDLNEEENQLAIDCWNKAMQNAIDSAEYLGNVLKAHKQLANRLTEAFSWQTCILSATEWDNWDNLRDHPAAQPEIRYTAQAMKKARQESIPKELKYGEWHLPLTSGGSVPELNASISLEDKIKICIGRVARVSYMTHDGEINLEKDIKLYHDLLADGHMSPFEHCARPFSQEEWLAIQELKDVLTGNKNIPDLFKLSLLNQLEFQGNFRGWVQHRKLLPNEFVYKI